MSVKKGSVYLIAGKVSFAASQWLQIVVLARYGTPEQLGAFTLALSIVTPILLFSSFQLENLVATDIEDKYPFNFYRRYQTLSIFFALTLLFLFIFIFFRNKADIGLFLVLGLMKSLEISSELYLSLARRFQKFRLISLTMMMRSITSIIVFLLFFLVTRDLILSLSLVLISRLILFLTYERKQTLPLTSTHSTKKVVNGYRSLFALSFPLGMVTLIDSLLVNIPRILIENFHGLAVLGRYMVVTSLLLISGILIMGLRQALMPKIARLYRAKQYREFKVLLIKAMLFSIGLALLTYLMSWLFGETFLKVVYGEQFGSLHHVLNLLVLSLLPGYPALVLLGILTACGFTGKQPYIIMFGFLVNLFSGIVLIPKWDMSGAAISLTATWTVILIGALIVFYNSHYSQKKLTII